MWYIKEGYGRREAVKVTADRALWLEENKGGKAVKFHTPNEYTGPLSSDNKFDGLIFGYVSNKKPIYSYPQIEVVVNGQVITTVTRKEDAFKIMHALKRDYKDVIVRGKDVSRK